MSQSALRTSHFELCIRPSTPLPTASTLCGTILGPNYCLLRPSHLDCDCLSLLASLCALPSSLLGPDPFLYHPALLGPHHAIACAPNCFGLWRHFDPHPKEVFSSSCLHFYDPTSRLTLRSAHQAIDCAPNCFVRWRHPDPHQVEVFSTNCLHFYLCSISQ